MCCQYEFPQLFCQGSSFAWSEHSRRTVVRHAMAMGAIGQPGPASLAYSSKYVNYLICNLILLQACRALRGAW